MTVAPRQLAKRLLVLASIFDLSQRSSPNEGPMHPRCPCAWASRAVTNGLHTLATNDRLIAEPLTVTNLQTEFLQQNWPCVKQIGVQIAYYMSISYFFSSFIALLPKGPAQTVAPYKFHFP
ncbi:Uncharacterized protein Fot_07929 [Forsythia ovata]|uniref:Uncharacterized protein n=1 Tax=Forsythia ovata TaxID=205694 RepID=A0ABD1WX71_9LAMI